MNKLALLLCAATIAGAGLARADTYPSRPITIVVPFPAGSSTDLVARTIGQKLSERVGQPVMVDNKVGAAGNIGSQAVATAAPDGYTLLMATVANPISAVSDSKLGYNFVRDLAPVTLVATAPLVIVARADYPAANVKELVELAKRKPGQLSYGSGGNGTATHFTGEMLKSTAGVNIVHVPYKGATAAMTDLMGGRIDFLLDNLVGVQGQLQGGKVKALAVTTKRRASTLPNTPTVAEAGLPGFDASGWQGLNVPAKTPKEIVERLNKEVVAILHSPEVKQKLEAGGAMVEGTSVEEYANFIQRESDKWAKVAKSANIHAE